MNQNRKSIAKTYLQYLEEGSTMNIVKLFAPEGTVSSPIYGNLPAQDFYEALENDTVNSTIELNGIFEDSESGKFALYFRYIWTIASGQIVEFDVVDIIKFDQDDKIMDLKIIYDTVVSRKIINEMKTKPK